MKVNHFYKTQNLDEKELVTLSSTNLRFNANRQNSLFNSRGLVKKSIDNYRHSKENSIEIDKKRGSMQTNNDFGNNLQIVNLMDDGDKGMNVEEKAYVNTNQISLRS